MLLTEMPARPDAPEPKRAIAFDQALRARIEELGLDEAGLVRRYVNYQRSQGDLKARSETRRKSLLELISGKRDPTLKTVFNLLDSQVLDGQLFVHWAGQDKPEIISERPLLAQIVQERMRKKGLEPKESRAIYEITRQYCDFKGKNRSLNPSNNLNLTRKLIGPNPNPRFQTVAIFVQILNGQLLLSWRRKIRQTFELPEAASTLIEDLPTNKVVVLEYQEMSKAEAIKFKTDEQSEIDS